MKATDQLEELGICMMISSEWILNIQAGRIWTALIWFRMKEISGRLL
jgi:hypothetical protein